MLFALCLYFAQHTSLQAQNTVPPTPPPLGSIAPDLETADSEVLQHESRWIRTIEAALIAENFDELDRMADRYRRDKTLLPGGDWRLRLFYKALDAPKRTDKDYVDHLEHLRRWMDKRPESITARVALATTLTRWAWVARTGAVADKVTPEGWRLFNLRANEARTVLEGSAEMRTMCPQWYSEMMLVGLALNWDNRREEEVFNRGVQFEPSYPYFYRERANYLLPKWDGEPGDATSFAKTQADRLGGDAGDRMYFEIATVIVKRGNGNLSPYVKQMDWTRIQRGYTALSTQAGSSRKTENQLAFMAWKFKDPAVARTQFATIGDEWSRGVWKERNNFDRARDWSNGHTSWP